MKLVGEYLKKQRETQKISLEKAALVTKISAGTLLAIEEANLKKLPSKSYLRGFVFSYGQFLNIDKDKLEQLFAEEMGSTNPEVQQEIIQQQTWQTIPVINKIRINAKTFIIAGLVAMLFVAISVRSLVKKYQNEKIIPPITEISETKKIKHLSPEQTSIADQKIETQPSQPATSGKTAAKINQDTIYQAAGGLKELIVEAKKDTSIRIKIGNKKEKVIKLLRGEFHTVKARSKLTFQAKDPKAINLIFNGALQTKLNDNNDPVKIIY